MIRTGQGVNCDQVCISLRIPREPQGIVALITMQASILFDKLGIWVTEALTPKPETLVTRNALHTITRRSLF